MTALQLQNLVTVIGAILVMAGLGGVAWLSLGGDASVGKVMTILSRTLFGTLFV